MGKLTAKIEEKRKQIQIKVYIFVCVVMLIVIGAYTYLQFEEYRFVSQGVQKSEVLASNLRSVVGEVRAQYEENRREFDQLEKVVEQNLEKVFPVNDDYTGLVRQLDSFEASIASGRSPFEVSSIEYQNVIEHENYSILPFRMNIQSSPQNFTKFLHMIENSGIIDGEVRLMNVSSIRLSFSGSPVAGSPSDIINFNVQINAYFRK